jgi:hypothetical protein
MFKKKEIMEKLVPIEDIPQSDVGAPLPCMVSNEQTLCLAYITRIIDSNWDGTHVKIVGSDTENENVAIVQFEMAYAHFFGPPNDEAIEGHPLYKLGLRPYSISRVEESTWIKEFVKRNSVHEFHRPDMLSTHSHFIFAFHDSTFECIAKGIKIHRFNGSMHQAISEMARIIERAEAR